MINFIFDFFRRVFLDFNEGTEYNTQIKAVTRGFALGHYFFEGQSD